MRGLKQLDMTHTTFFNERPISIQRLEAHFSCIEYHKKDLYRRGSHAVRRRCSTA